MRKKIIYVIAVTIIVFAFQKCKNSDQIKEKALVVSPSDFNGKWKIVPDTSTLIDLYKTLTVEIKFNVPNLSLIMKWGDGKGALIDTFNLKTNSTPIEVPIKSRVFPTHVFMGLKMPVGEKRTLKASWDGSVLKIDESFNIIGSQGPSPVKVEHVFELTSNKELLTYTISRSTRKGSTIKYTLKKDGYREAYFMRLKDNWDIDSGLSENALLISLQGIANSDGAYLYYIYPETWNFNYTENIFNFYKKKKNFTFTELGNINYALNTFKSKVEGYIVWDKKVRTSLIVAFTAAGIENAIVVSEDEIAMVEKYGIKKIEDFRGMFTKKTDLQIYEWAYKQYWDKCSKDLIIWMGGDHGNIMKPGIADWGIHNKAFFNDLCTREEDTTGEYLFAYKLLSEIKPMSMVMGWHSYAKDRERDHVKLTSRFGHKVEGLHSLPNISFNSQVPVTPGFKFKNNHNIIPGKEYIPEKKVYMACVQTDGLGIGAWSKPGRGEIPYAWECLIGFESLAPSVLEYYYSEATPNDYFIGALSGPGYQYPKAIPDIYLDSLVKESSRIMKLLDLNSFDIMDYSEGAAVDGNADLTNREINAFYKYMPNSIGFVNGYAPAHTFTCRDKKPLISFEYYLSPDVKQEEAVMDLIELGNINVIRPYFILIHVRESSNVKRVKDILNKLPKEYELVPLDVFFKYAGNNPTFKENILNKSKVDHSLPLVKYKGK